MKHAPYGLIAGMLTVRSRRLWESFPDAFTNQKDRSSSEYEDPELTVIEQRATRSIASVFSLEIGRSGGSSRSLRELVHRQHV